MTPISVHVQTLRSQFGDVIAEPIEFRGEITLTVTDAQRVAEVCLFAKKQLGFDYLVDVSSIDNFETEPRYTLVYELYSYTDRCHLRLKTSILSEPGELPSVTPIWRGANWHEREIYDMMGIRFSGHPDLRRIIMWEGYPYYPLRKDFPVAGKPSDIPEVAFTSPAPSEGGPFVTTPGGSDAADREPRARQEEA